MVKYNRFEVKNENEDQDQSIPKSIGTLTVLRCIFGPNLESLTPFGMLTCRPDKLTSPKWGKFWLLSSIWPWRSRSMNPKNNRDLNQGVLHFWSKFGDCSFSGWQVIVRTNWWLTDTHTHIHTHTHTHRQTQATTIPEGHNWPRVIILNSLRSRQNYRHFADDISKWLVVSWTLYTDTSQPKKSPWLVQSTVVSFIGIVSCMIANLCRWNTYLVRHLRYHKCYGNQ